MISKLAILDPKKTPINWLGKSKFLSEPREFNFSSGLNILWGKNGAGKSTLLRLIARLFHAEQGRISTVTQTSLQELFGLFDSKVSGVGVDHDGQGIIFYDPTDKVGLIGNGAGFDYDFLQDGVQSITTKGSSGQLTNHGLARAMMPLQKTNYIKPVYKIRKENVNEFYVKRLECTEQFFEATIPVGNPTVLLDEPDRSLDIPAQQEQWEALGKVTRIQIITATHSVFACNIPGANYIELTPGYLKECRDAVSKLQGPNVP